MKFGKFIKSRINADWKFYYIDYDGLKNILKQRNQRPFTEADEANFAETFEKEVQRVFDFRDVKAGELIRHVQHCESIMQNYGQNFLEDQPALESEIERIMIELSELGVFSRLNITGFWKILKKHDKFTSFHLKPMFSLRLKSRSKSFECLEELIFRISKLYDQIRQKRLEVTGTPWGEHPKDDNGVNVFIRQTTKYWVHPDNIMEVKLCILKHLPILSFASTKRKVDLLVSSIYFDNSAFELYKKRLEKMDKALAIRIRWYGSEDGPKEVFVERKLHREDWTGELSEKTRFRLKEKHLNDFIRGTYPISAIKERFKKDGIKDEEIDKISDLAKEIQEIVIEKKLQPTIRTIYNRTAFQFPGDARVRISLDTDLLMVREDGNERSGKNWKREDLEIIDFPFNSLPPTEIVRFPYAVMEVKIQTHAGQEPPPWIQKLIKSHLVEEVPKFSKYLHGCATLFKENIGAIPYWLPQMEVDIRKPDSGNTLLLMESELYRNDGIAAGSENFQNLELVPRESGSTISSSETSICCQKEPLDHVTVDIWEETASAGISAPESEPLLRQRKVGESRNGIIGCLYEAWRKVFHPRGKEEIGIQVQRERKNVTDKRIHIPVRIEPKVYFANERTFLSWVHFSIFLGGIGAALVGLGDGKARASGFIFGITSILLSAYALYLYYWRAKNIREGSTGPYEDQFGPLLVVIIFIFAMIANMTFVAYGSGKGQRTNQGSP